MKKHQLSFLATSMLIGLIPLAVAAVTISTVAINKTKSNLEERVYLQLQACAISVREYFEWDINEDILEVDEVSLDFIDSLTVQDVDLTLFLEDVRFITSIYNEDGQRNVGTKASEGIWDFVKQGKDYRTNGTVIGGREYYVYYTPVCSESGEIIGMAFAGMPESLVNESITSNTKSMVLVAVCTAAFCIVLIVLIALRIRKSIIGIADYTHELSAGRLSVSTSCASNIREIAAVIDSAESLQDNLKKIISKVDDKTLRLTQNVKTIHDGIQISNDATEGIVRAANELAEGSMHTAESVQNTAASMQNVGESISSIAESAAEAEAGAREIEVINIEAKDNLTRLIKANKNTVTISENVVTGINEANSAIENIRKAADAITNIAAQTSMLSLNASIEAARAGEAGRGFAVVASSIQSLAGESDNSAKEIQNIINEIISKSQNNVQLANEIKNAIDSEGDALATVSNSFDKVSDKIRITVDTIHNISTESDVLNQDKGKVLDEIRSLSAISEENTASCQETTASIEELRKNIEMINVQATDTDNISEELKESVAYFKL
ncbi:MAG: cache domain-containing protein [Lachnospiraceae bacterium]|nr:cache domain-containing protein [Lachnospiraceae bacterium]